MQPGIRALEETRGESIRANKLTVFGTKTQNFRHSLCRFCASRIIQLCSFSRYSLYLPTRHSRRTLSHLELAPALRPEITLIKPIRSYIVEQQRYAIYMTLIYGCKQRCNSKTVINLQTLNQWKNNWSIHLNLHHFVWGNHIFLSVHSQQHSELEFFHF